MKKLLFLLILITETVSAAPSYYTVTDTTEAEISKELWVGAKIYEQTYGVGCGSCHNIKFNPDLFKTVPNIPIDQFTEILTSGRNGMPAVLSAIMSLGVVKLNNLSEAEAINAIYYYLNIRASDNITTTKLIKIK